VKVHTNVLTAGDVHAAMRDMPVTYAQVTVKGSRSHERRLDIHLYAFEDGPGRRRPNFGKNPEEWAAHWDEWGILIQRLFVADPAAHIGQYGEEAEFHWQTGNRFKDLDVADIHPIHAWQFTGLPGENYCACGAVQRWHVTPVEQDA